MCHYIVIKALTGWMETVPGACGSGHRGASLRLGKCHYVIIGSVFKEAGECKLRTQNEHANVTARSR